MGDLNNLLLTRIVSFIDQLWLKIGNRGRKWQSIRRHKLIAVNYWHLNLNSNKNLYLVESKIRQLSDKKKKPKITNSLSVNNWNANCIPNRRILNQIKSKPNIRLYNPNLTLLTYISHNWLLTFPSTKLLSSSTIPPTHPLPTRMKKVRPKVCLKWMTLRGSFRCHCLWQITRMTCVYTSTNTHSVTLPISYFVNNRINIGSMHRHYLSSWCAPQLIIVRQFHWQNEWTNRGRYVDAAFELYCIALGNELNSRWMHQSSFSHWRHNTMSRV